MKRWVCVWCLLVCTAASICGGENEPPPNLILLYGALAKPIWKSYHQEGRLDLDLFIRDHLKIGSIHDGDCEEFLAWCLIQIEEDPKPVLDALLKSSDAEEVGFALYTVWSLQDRRFYDQAAALTESEMVLSGWGWSSVSDMAGSIRDLLEDELVIDLREADGMTRKIYSSRAQWHRDVFRTDAEVKASPR